MSCGAPSPQSEAGGATEAMPEGSSQPEGSFEVRKREESLVFLQQHVGTLFARLRQKPHLLASADKQSGKTLSEELTNAVYDGVPPSFEDSGARVQYTLDRGPSRVGQIYETLLCQDDVVSGWRQQVFGGGRGHVRIASMGGGPGFDVVASALAAAFVATGASLCCTVFEREPGWKPLVMELERELLQTFRECQTRSPELRPVRFDSCDIGLPLTHPSNAGVAAAVAEGLDLMVFSYVVHENEAALREPGTPVADGVGGIFPELFASLASSAPSAAVLLLDATPRLWPSMVAAARPLGFREHIPDMLSGRCRQKETLLLLPAACADLGGCPSRQRIMRQLARHETYLVASDRKRMRLRSQGVQVQLRPVEPQFVQGVYGAQMLQVAGAAGEAQMV